MSKAYTKTYFELMEQVVANHHHGHITTLTCMFRLNRTLSIADLYNKFNEEGVDVRLSRNAYDYYKTKRQKTMKVFYNQISLIFKDFSKKSIKLFTNGNVHVTGLSSWYDFQMTRDLVMEWINKYMNDRDREDTSQCADNQECTECTEYVVQDQSERIVMINGCFQVQQHIKLKSFASDIRSNPFIDSIRYNPETYPAVNVKMKSGVSIFIFSTGKFIVSAKNIEAFKNGYVHMAFPKLAKTELPPHYPSSNLFHGYDLKAFTNCLY